MHDTWVNFSPHEQLIMIANECNRAASAQERQDIEGARKAIERGLDLIDRTVEDPQWKGRYSELLKFRESLAAQYLHPTSSSLRLLIDWLARYAQAPQKAEFVRE